jgi:hypothetical protein
MKGIHGTLKGSAMEDGTAVKQILKNKQKGRRNLGQTKEIDRSIRYT